MTATLNSILANNESVDGRSFTSPHLYRSDARAMSYMLHDLKCLIDAEKLPIQAHASVGWETNGLSRRTMVCDYANLTSPHESLCFVGFFGERHLDRSSDALEEANAELVLEFKDYPGILSYSSMELYDGNWANLVIHDVPDTKEYWRASTRHAEAATQLSPQYYRTVRIHNGEILGGLSGGGELQIQSTKYWDYGAPEVWHATRDLVKNAPSLHDQ